MALEIRIAMLDAFEARGFGHISGSLSAADLLAALYGKVMNVKPGDPDWADRDRFVSSKGHAGPAIYATLALKGYFGKELLKTLNQPNTTLPSHCDRVLTTGIDMTTGSLGQGSSLAAGMALGLKLAGSPANVYLLMGDGECNEGQVWEMALFAPAKKLTNLIAFVDYNGKQLDGRTDDIIPMGDISAKFREFGWHSVEIDGHDPDLIASTVESAKAAQGDKPICIVLKTVKGKGIKDIEDMELNHHINTPKEQTQKWRAELQAQLV